LNGNPHHNLIRRFLELWARGEADMLREMFTEDAITHVSATRTEPSREFEPRACASWAAGFSEPDLQIRKIVAERDSVTAYWVITATHTAEFVGMPATQREVTFSGMEIHRIDEDKIAEVWRISDTFDLMNQLGAE